MAANIQLKQLAERSRNVANAILNRDLPPIERNLEQIEKQSRKLADKVVKPGETPERKAPYFLANIGIDGDKLTQEVKSINVLGAFEPRVVLPDTDVEKYLDHKHQQTITSIIKDGYAQTINDYNSHFDRCLHQDWDKFKRKVFEELGQHVPVSSVGSLESSIGVGNSRSMTQSRFSSSTSLPSSSDFRSTMGKKLVQCWQALACIVGEDNVVDGRFTRNPLKQGHFKTVYNSPSDADYKSFCRYLINGSRRYLEESYRSWSNIYVNSFRSEAMLGGMPSAINMARAVLRAIHRPNGGIPTDNLHMTDSVPIWGHIFVLVRQGFYQEALEVARGYEPLLPRQDSQFITYFSRFVSNNNSLPSQDRQKLVAEMKQWNPLTFQDKDPYKFIMYQIVAQLEELPQKPQIESVIPTSEDFMWMKLMCIREIESVGGISSDTLSLEGLQKTIRNLGPNHFNHGGKDPIQYFRALLLTAQFERAVHYLYQTDHTEDAVHFAVALAYYGLLRIPDYGETMALLVEVAVPYLNFNTLIVQYARSLVKENAPSTALHYLLLLYLHCNPRTESGYFQVELCHENVRQLVYDTEAFTDLVGDARRKEGLIRKYMSLMYIESDKEYTGIVVNTLARQCVEDGKFKSARNLYELTENYEEIVALFNKMLAEYIWISIRGVTFQPETAKELDPKEITRTLKDYEQHHVTMRISQDLLRDCRTRLGLVEFVEMHKQQNFARALIQQIELFPFEDDINIIQKKASAIEASDDQMKNCVPELLHITMRCIHAYYQQLKDQMTRGTPGLNRRHIEESAALQRKAKALVTFAGYLKYR
ncbi:15854_t:CDS:10 [Acaulospora colombiana]|uniref:15854_t:CDS:1 n=1 Tax=Acaulospora colombiana TaxID=27376 RepID=A0ACA9KEH8_9GLOM|nr:15854_t:CDS:10 [Acaulospora colombiana]